MATLVTPFGEFKGKHGHDVVQYLGIKYAHVSDQLSAPKMVESYSGVIDATEYGPRAPAVEAGSFEQEVLIQQVIDRSTPPRASGTECLNLNITVPNAKIEDRKLPVMVFIHGGGFLMGRNSLAYNDTSHLVRLSAEVGMPLILVSINYRLSVLGNITSEELRGAGYPGNNALRDQKCALRWVKAHIGGFGGDPNNVTAFGVSAGSVAVLTQLLSSEPLFKRAIAMSGTPIMLKPLAPSEAEETYRVVIEALGLLDVSKEERIQHLSSVEEDGLLQKTTNLTNARLSPSLDDDVLPSRVTYKSLQSATDCLDAQIPGRRWCEEVMIGDCKHDGNVFLFMGLTAKASNIAASLYTSFETCIGTSTTATVLEAYGITPSTPHDMAMQAAIAFGTDIAYYAPSLSLARSWPGKTYYYQFNEPNRWEGTFKGCSTHLLDAAYLFQNFNSRLEEGGQKVAESLAKKFIAFANGVRPWEEFDAKRGNVQVFGVSEEVTEGILEENGWNHGRRNTLFKLEEEGKIDLDALSVAWDSFLAEM